MEDDLSLSFVNFYQSPVLLEASQQTVDHQLVALEVRKKCFGIIWSELQTQVPQKQSCLRIKTQKHTWQCTRWPCVRQKAKSTVTSKMDCKQFEQAWKLEPSPVCDITQQHNGTAVFSIKNSLQALIRESAHTWQGGARERGRGLPTGGMYVLFLLLLLPPALVDDVLFCDRVYQLPNR